MNNLFFMIPMFLLMTTSVSVERNVPTILIQEIVFEGNTIFSDRELVAKLRTTKVGTPYFKENLYRDLQLGLLTGYREQGYMEASVDSDVELVRPEDGPHYQKVTIRLDEGPQIRYGDFALLGVTAVDLEEVNNIFSIQPGDLVNYTKLKRATDDLKRFYWERGYLDLDVRPDIAILPESNILDLTIDVKEGNPYSIVHIDFVGDGLDLRSEEKLLQTFLLRDGDTYNSVLLDRSMAAWRKLGDFEDIELEVNKRPEPERVDIVVRLKK